MDTECVSMVEAGTSEEVAAVGMAWAPDPVDVAVLTDTTAAEPDTEQATHCKYLVASGEILFAALELRLVLGVVREGWLKGVELPVSLSLPVLSEENWARLVAVALEVVARDGHCPAWADSAVANGGEEVVVLDDAVLACRRNSSEENAVADELMPYRSPRCS